MVTNAVRLVVDLASCDGHGICVLRCPELVTLDEWGFAGAERGETSDARIVRRARRAVAACPRHALSLIETPGAGRRPHLISLPDQGGNRSRDLLEVEKVNNRGHGGR